FAAQRVPPLRRGVEQPEDREQRRLPASRRTRDGDVFAWPDLEVHVGEGMCLHLVRVEDFLDPFHADQGLGYGGGGAGEREIGGTGHWILTLLLLSNLDMSETMTLSPFCRPETTSIVVTDARPSLTLTRIAVSPSRSSLNSPTVLSGCP